MKTVAQLQEELRTARKELKSIDSRLEQIGSELANYKTSVSDNSEYQRVYEIAKTMPVINHPIVAETMAVKNNYFGILLMLASSDDSLSEDQLLFLQRMILADKNNCRIDIYLGNLGNIQPENVLFKMNDTVKDKLADSLLLDMMILAKLSRGTTTNSYEIIANIAVFLNKDKPSITQTAVIAAAILKQNIENINYSSSETIAFDDLYGHYLGEIKGWNERISKAREEQTKNEKQNYNQMSDIAYFYNSWEEDEYGRDWYYYL